MERVSLVLGGAFLALLCALTLLGAHRAALVGLLAVHRRRRAPAGAETTGSALPFVTVQLPVYNEAAVAGACMTAAARLDYPRDRFEVQVLDDSDDETRSIVDATAADLRATGVSVAVVRRPTRDGYKAGALAHGLEQARGELVAIFDADFTPPPDFLRRAVPAFHDPAVGLVQARWDHANAGRSLLTRVQALLLDGHFLVEQEARFRSGRPFNFNGTAGVLRRSAIESAGNWSADTLTEDLDLSLRAQLVGWRFVFLDDLAAVGELPADMGSFRSQQRRWVQGSAQTARKLLPAVWTAPGFPFTSRVEATTHLLLNAGYALALALALVTVPVAALTTRGELPVVGAATGWVFWASTLSVGGFLLVAQARRRPGGVLAALPLMPFAFALGLGLSLSNGRAYVAGLLRPGGEFVRTPKRGAAGARVYLARGSAAEAILELGLGLYCGLGAAAELARGGALAAPLLALFMIGFVWVGAASLLERRAERRPGADQVS